MGRDGSARPPNRKGPACQGTWHQYRAGADLLGVRSTGRPLRLPAVNDAAWPRSPLDRFLLSALEAKGPHPAPRAEKRTLIRRTAFDLTGLPHTYYIMAGIFRSILTMDLFKAVARWHEVSPASPKDEARVRGPQGQARQAKGGDRHPGQALDQRNSRPRPGSDFVLPKKTPNPSSPTRPRPN